MTQTAKTFPRDVADRLDAERRERGITLRELADAAKMPGRTLRRRMAKPDGLDLTEVFRLAAALDLNPSALLQGRASSRTDDALATDIDRRDERRPTA
jgi:transcriptional regulator with XRE-family HTH domain